MAKTIRKGNNPSRERLLDLGMGMLGGVLAGAGVSYLISSQKTKSAESGKKDKANRKIAETSSTHSSRPSKRRSVTGINRRSKAPGTNLAATNLQHKEIEAKEEPGANDSLGG